MRQYTLTFTATAEDETAALEMIKNGTATLTKSRSEFVPPTKIPSAPAQAPGTPPKANDPVAHAMALKLAGGK